MSKEPNIYKKAKNLGYSYGEYVGYLTTHNGQEPPKKNIGDRDSINFWWKK